MKQFSALAASAALLGICGLANADTSSGTLTVTGTVESSIGLTLESDGATLTGATTATASFDLGNISKFGRTPPSGFTLARGASNWTLSSSFGVKVLKSNLTSTDYTLTAQLGSAPASGIAWKLNTIALNATTATPLTLVGSYTQTDPYAWDIVIADTTAANAAIDNSIQFTATAN